MANTPTTTESVASRLTDEEIERFAQIIEDSDIVGQDAKIVAVLRDYVRLRKLVNEVKSAFDEFSAQYEYRIIENADTRDMGREELADDENWQALKRLLA